MCMYDGHDMSSHEVVVRSLLEVLQEFDDASDGDRTVRIFSARCVLVGVSLHLEIAVSGATAVALRMLDSSKFAAP